MLYIAFEIFLIYMAFIGVKTWLGKNKDGK